MINIKKLTLLFIFTWPLASPGTSAEKNFYDSIKNNHPNLKDAILKPKKTENINNYYYFCGTATYRDGHPVKTDEFIEVYDLIMSNKNNSQWKEIANFNSFSPTGKAECHLSHGLNDFLSKMNFSENNCSTIESNNPERKIILDAVRGSLKDKFIVKRLCSSPKAAYFCGASQGSDGFIEKTDEAIDVYDVILKKNTDGTWVKVKDLGGFAMSIDDIKCHFGNSNVILDNSIIDKASENFSDSQ